MIVKSDNNTVKMMLFQLEKLLVENGAWFHPNLALRCKDNTISVEMAGPCPAEETIIKIPDDLLVPSEPLNISIEGDKFILTPDKSKLSKTQLEIATLMFGIYNATNRINSYKACNPWVCFKETPYLMNRLSKTRTENEIQQPRDDFLNGLPNALSMEEFILYDFIGSRVIGHIKENDDQMVQKIMPIVDYFLHDYRGQTYMFAKEKSTEQDRQDDSSFLKIINIQPFPASPTCYVSYGTYDAVDIFMNYGFINKEAVFLYSIPMEIKIPGTDGLIVNSIPYVRKGKVSKPFADIKQFVPSITRSTDNKALVLSCLAITIPPRGNALRRILRATIRTLGGEHISKEFILEQTLIAEKFIIEENIGFYEALLEDIENDKETPVHLKDRVYKVVYAQLNKLYKYAHIESLVDIEKEAEDYGEEAELETAIDTDIEEIKEDEAKLSGTAN